MFNNGTPLMTDRIIIFSAFILQIDIETAGMSPNVCWLHDDHRTRSYHRSSKEMNESRKRGKMRMTMVMETVTFQRRGCRHTFARG